MAILHGALPEPIIALLMPFAFCLLISRTELTDVLFAILRVQMARTKVA